MAVLVVTDLVAATYYAELKRARIAAVSLKKYNGTTADAVKVGTVRRAKGLEFRRVLHPSSSRRRSAKLSPEALAEQYELDRHTLFVAMTRARDALWIGELTAAL